MNRTVKESLTVGTTEDSSVVAPTVRERPILFSAPMVRAIQEDRKTQTRRVAKPGKRPSLLNGEWSDSYVLDPGNREWLMRDCPYGAPGDRLWVKETWQAWVQTSHEGDEWAPCEGPPRELLDRYGNPDVEYKATSSSLGPWRPSIFMPRWASRITLGIVSVRVERLHDISLEDAIAEGIERGRDFFMGQIQCSMWKDYLAEGAWFTDDPIASFRSLWESINGLGSWDANPWVWVVEFERCREAA